jgi:hypothetical protein
MTPRPAQRRRAGDALRKCDNDPHVLLQVRAWARCMLGEGGGAVCVPHLHLYTLSTW